MAEIQENATDDVSWAERSAFWNSEYLRMQPNRAKRERNASPLILGGHGVLLRIEGGSLLIRNGFTHYPQQREEFRFFRGDLSLPTRIVMLDGSGSLSFDVLAWLSEQDIPLVRVDWRGEIVAVVGGHGFSANPHKLRWQRETRADPGKRLEFCIGLIQRKIEGCILTLEKAIRRSPAWEKAMERAYADLTRLECDPPKDITKLRAIEAGSAAAYFRAWRAVPLKWRTSARHPIPDDWRSIGQRNTLFATATNRNASHPVNALLNYAYTVLQSQLQIQAVADGYDPTIGIMHEGRDASSAFIFDLMEPDRPKVDRNVLKFIAVHPLDPADFVIRPDGVCRLNPQLARVVAGLAQQGNAMAL